MKLRIPRSYGSRSYFAVVFAVLVGLVFVVAGPWRFGLQVIGLAFLGGALARLVSTESHTGMLRVRGRAFDVLWMGLLGLALIVLAIIVPAQLDS